MGNDKNEFRFFDPRESPAKIYGLADNGYCRVPEHVLAQMSAGLRGLALQPSGGRVRFHTDSDKLYVKLAVFIEPSMPHMPSSGSSGLDFFEGVGTDMKYIGTRQPECGQRKLEAEIPLTKGEKTVTVYLPLYNGIRSLAFGVEPGAAVTAPPLYTHEKPIVFYSSSITQGGSASRTSNSYCAMLARHFDSDFINLGFSGSAKGELYMAEYIAGLEMSCFVLDYDHNAPDAEYLRKTHYPFLQTVLDLQPGLPVIVLSKSDTRFSRADNERRDIVRDSCRLAKAKGHPVHFIDGGELFGDRDRDACTVDGCHPNDLGFYRMAERITPVFSEILDG